MKLKIISLSLIFITFFGCCNDCKKNLKETQIALDTCKKEQEFYEAIKSMQKQLFPIPDDLKDQNIISINNFPDRNRLKKPYNVTGTISKNTIHLNIATPNDQLKIVNYLNISTTKTNALLVIVDDGTNELTSSTVTNVIKKKIDINKTGLNTTLLEEHAKLMVIVLHDNNFNANHVTGYQRKIIKHPGYENLEDCLMRNWDIDKLVPDEDGGDIIP